MPPSLPAAKRLGGPALWICSLPPPPVQLRFRSTPETVVTFAGWRVSWKWLQSEHLCPDRQPADRPAQLMAAIGCLGGYFPKVAKCLPIPLVKLSM